MPDPVMLATWSFGSRGNAAAWAPLSAGGSALDAVELAARTVEIDPEVDSVGFGGLPDAAGNVTLDACIMTSPTRHGAVCAVRKHLHVISLARQVMEQTAHRLIAGEAADAFAEALGEPEADLLAAEARDQWERWRAEGRRTVDQSRDSGKAQPNLGPVGALRPVDRPDVAGRLFVDLPPVPHAAPGAVDRGPDEAADSHGDGDRERDGDRDRDRDGDGDGESRWRHRHDTISVLALDRAGQLAGACSTSGMPYKQPGRVGDSPIVGHGLYVDPQVGAAAATGRGELIMDVCGSFLAVELMRRGASPLDALREVLERVRAAHELEPTDQVALIALTPGGEFATAALRPGFRAAVRTSERESIIAPNLVLLPEETPT